MAVPFIILANQRSGSSYVVDFLNSHPEAKVYGELFMSSPKRQRPLWKPNDLEFARAFVNRHTRRRTGLARPYWTWRYLERVFDQPAARAAGVKLTYDQIRVWPETLPYVAVRRVGVVHVLRRNLIDIVLSDLVRQRRGVWQIANDGRPQLPGEKRSPDDTKIRLDPDELMRSLRELAFNRRVVRTWLSVTRTPTLEVEYERLVTGPEQFADVLEFIGLDPGDWRLLKSGLDKMNTRTHAELIENLGEIESRLSETDFAGFLRR
jgi:LPS sulfotransferase NodH